MKVETEKFIAMILISLYLVLVLHFLVINNTKEPLNDYNESSKLHLSII